MDQLHLDASHRMRAYATRYQKNVNAQKKEDVDHFFGGLSAYADRMGSQGPNQ